MVCPKCGKRNKKDVTKCIVCGKVLVKKNAKEKTDELIDSITSTIDVAAIKKAEKSLVYNIKHISPKIIITAIILIMTILITVSFSVGLKKVSCSYKSKEDNWLYRSNINFNYKKNKITRFKMRLEYSAFSNSYKGEFKDIYNNIIENLEEKDNFKYIVKSSLGSKHFSIIYNFSPKYVNQVYDYTGINIEDNEYVGEFIKSLEDSGFECR